MAFDVCLGERTALYAIATQKRVWKPFSCLVRALMLNGQIEKAFDLLLNVHIEEEQLLDPLLGSLSFPAQVLSTEKELLAERIYVTFSCGNLGMCLAPRENARGCQVISFQPIARCPHTPVSCSGAATLLTRWLSISLSVVVIRQTLRPSRAIRPSKPVGASRNTTSWRPSTANKSGSTPSATSSRASSTPIGP